MDDDSDNSIGLCQGSGVGSGNVGDDMVGTSKKVAGSTSSLEEILDSEQKGDGKECLGAMKKQGLRFKVEKVGDVKRLTNKSVDFALLYDQAGEKVEEEESQISLMKYHHLWRDEVATIIAEVLEEHPLSFHLQDFQKLALHAIGNLQNVILLTPTGSGKMIVALLSILVLQRKLHKPDGVGVGTMPLSSIIQEKIQDSYIPTGTISMHGGLKSSNEREDEDIILSSPIEDFKNGNLKCLIGHAESWLSSTAGEILDSLQEKQLIIFNFLDEAHIPLTGRDSTIYQFPI